MDNYKDAAQLSALTKPQDPVFCLRPHAATQAAQFFVNTFPGQTFYAVKANPSPWLLKALYRAGVTRFEVASLAEARLIHDLFPSADIAFMNPIKSGEAIKTAYQDLGVRIFALDSQEELDKIFHVLKGADDLTLCIRHKVENPTAKMSLNDKFGVEGEAAAHLMQQARHKAARLGVAFHVGSQTMSPEAYVAALNVVEQTIIRAGVIVDVLDVGGGFPAIYPGMTPPPLAAYFSAIAGRFREMLVAENCTLWCEPGRALSAEAASLIVRVEARKGDDLYINDGVYGALFDAGHLNWPFTATLLQQDPKPSLHQGFRFFGPTCDDLDKMTGPFLLPHHVQPGDYIEIATLGAYGFALRTGFNGLGAYEQAFVDDTPAASMYGPACDEAQIAGAHLSDVMIEEHPQHA